MNELDTKVVEKTDQLDVPVELRRQKPEEQQVQSEEVSDTKETEQRDVTHVL